MLILKLRNAGLVIPQLQAYRIGNSDAPPALHQHPDYAFPPIVVIDLEVDSQPDAPKGSLVFEVAASGKRNDIPRALWLLYQTKLLSRPNGREKWQ